MDLQGMRDLDTEKQIWSGPCRVSRLWLGVHVTTDKVLHLDLILIDTKGNDIWVHIPPLLQEKFKRLLKEQHVYIIKNCELNPTESGYRPIANPYIMSFSRKTTVQHVSEVPSIPKFKFTFMKASDMPDKFGDTTILEDVVGQLVQHSDPISTSNITRKTIRKELQVKLLEGDVVKVVVWGRLVDAVEKIITDLQNQPITLVITAVIVNTFKEAFSFSSSGSTVLYANLDIPEVRAFTTRDEQPQQPALVEPTPAKQIPVISLAELLELQADPDMEEMVFSVECKVVGIKPGWCYMGCPNCVFKPIQRQGQFYCVRCNKTSPHKAAKYRIQIEVESDSRPATFTMFEYEGKRFFGVSADQLFHKTGQNSDSPPEELLQLVGLTKSFTIKFKINLYGDGLADFTVLKIKDPTPQESDSTLHKDGSCSSITSGLESSLPSPHHSEQIGSKEAPDEQDEATPPPDKKLKTKMV
ncbi:unnamed protein product [Linum trigynum]|uniref:Replication factor A C-terminal domain-containing protein n=1 Tax=Linum trigynum TaxID=586398 RepID=A0AAV2GUM4_9ROSI